MAEESHVTVCSDGRVLAQVWVDGILRFVDRMTPVTARRLGNDLLAAAVVAEGRQERESGQQELPLDLEPPAAGSEVGQVEGWAVKLIEVEDGDGDLRDVALVPIPTDTILLTKRFISDPAEIVAAGKGGLEWSPRAFYEIQCPNGEEGFLPVFRRRREK